MNTPSLKTQQIHRVVKFRWSVQQVGPKEVELTIPVDATQTPLVVISEEAAAELQLSRAEYDRAYEAALDAVITEIMVVK